MKICHMTSAHKTTDGRIFLKECSSLSAYYETYLVGQGDSREENNVKVVGVGEMPKSKLKRMLFFAKRVYKQAKSLDADVYHLHDPELIPYGLKLKKLGKKVIFDSHENTLEYMDTKKWIPKFLRSFVAKSYKKYATKAFKKFDALISVTPFICDELVKINPNTYLVTNYPIIQNYDLETTQKEKNTICFTGMLDPKWCLHKIISNLHKTKVEKFIICGKSNEYFESLKDLPNYEKVEYKGLLKPSEVPDVQKVCQIGVGVCEFEKNSSGNKGSLGVTKIFEYMMVGLPLVCTKNLALQEVVKKYNCGICADPYNEQEIIDAINYLIENPEKAEEMGRNGRMAVEQEFNWKTQEQELLKLYNNITK